MFNILRRMNSKRPTDEDVRTVAERQLEKNRAVIESLRDYDEGKKTIPTADLERRLRDIRTAA